VLLPCLLHVLLPRHRRLLGAGLHLSQLSRFRGPSHRDDTWQWFAFDTPEAVLPYSRCQDATIKPGVIQWELGYELEWFLKNWAIAALNLNLTTKGNLKRPDQEHLARCIRGLRVKIKTDLQMWLENDSRYQVLIRDRVNEAIQNLLEQRKEKTPA
jgi:hypothetical protein